MNDYTMNQRRGLSSRGLFELGRRFEYLRVILYTSFATEEILEALEPLTRFKGVEGFDWLTTEAQQEFEQLRQLELAKRNRALLPSPIINLNQKERRRLQDTVSRWATLLQQQLPHFWLVTPGRHIIQTTRITQGPKSFVEPELLGLLNEMEHSDLWESCGCILVGSYTAAEFIALRSAESLLRRWHERKTGVTLERRTWGRVLDALTDSYPEKQRPKELKLLGYLKERRDEVAHPDRSSTSQEAETTLMNVFSLVQSLREFL